MSSVEGRTDCASYRATSEFGPVSDIGIVDSSPQVHYAYCIHNPQWELKNEGRLCLHILLFKPLLRTNPNIKSTAKRSFRSSLRLAARGAKVEVLEGEHDTRSIVMFEFPTMEAIHAFWNSPDYVPIKKLREGAATINVWAFSGV